MKDGKVTKRRKEVYVNLLYNNTEKFKAHTDHPRAAPDVEGDHHVCPPHCFVSAVVFDEELQEQHLVSRARVNTVEDTIDHVVLVRHKVADGGEAQLTERVVQKELEH